MSTDVGENAIDIALKVAHAPSSVGAEYFVGGSLASSFRDALGDDFELVWFREGGEVSEKQRRDIVSVLRVSGDTMDAAYLDGWATRLKLDALLARAREARIPDLPKR